jgi:hypothetical protein
VDWVDALGWVGSALLLWSLLQARVLRFRLLNLVACTVLVVFNAILGIWSMVAMNLALAVINLYFIRKLLGDRHDDVAYTVLEVSADDAYLRHVLNVHADDIAALFPAYRTDDTADRSAFLVQRGDETVGVVLLRDAGGGVAQVDLDYVTPRFRDFTPGEFVYRRSGLFRDRGFREVRTPPCMVAPYYARLGFTQVGDAYCLELR